MNILMNENKKVKIEYLWADDYLADNEELFFNTFINKETKEYIHTKSFPYPVEYEINKQKGILNNYNEFKDLIKKFGNDFFTMTSIKIKNINKKI